MLLKSKKGFTLVEMLIVIVIIGILAAALIPKLMGAQDQANDTARLSHLNQIGTSLAVYGADNNGIPQGTGDAEDILSGMVGTYIKKIDVDPQSSNPPAEFCDTSKSSTGSYIYSSLTTNNFVLAANTQVAKKGNRTHAGSGCSSYTGLSDVTTDITAGNGDMYVYAN